MNQAIKGIRSYIKPMVIGLIFFIVVLSLLTMIYTTSRLEPLTDNWRVTINSKVLSSTFPISHVLRSGEEITIKKTIVLPSNRDFLTFSVYPIIKGQLLVDGQVIAEMNPKREIEQTPPPYLFLSYQIPEELLKQRIEIAIKAKGPQEVYLAYPPMLANSKIIKQSTFRVHFVESYIYILAIGVQLVIVFLMFVIGNNMRSFRKSYINIGIGELLQALYLAFIVLAFNTTLFQGNGFYDYLVPLLMLMSFVFLFKGLEYYILKQFRLTQYFWIGVPFVFLFYLLIPWSLEIKHRVAIIYLLVINLYMIYLSVKYTKIKLLQVSLFILFFSILNDFYFRTLFHAFPLPTMQQNALMIMSFVFGSFFTYQFIKHYREEKRLRMGLSESLEEVRAANEELEISYQEIESLNNTLEEKVLERTQKLNYTLRDLKMIMNNTEQGFLTLDKSLRVESTFSQECKRIFNKDLNDAFFPTLLYPNDLEEAAFVEKIITTIQQEEDDLKREAYLSLLPEKMVINDLFIEFEYKWIEDAIPGEMQLMMILTDVTKRIELENRVEEERNKLSKIIKIILNLEEFRRMGTDYRSFVQYEMKDLYSKHLSQESILVIKRRLHTFKGGFASFGLKYIEEKLHMVEDAIQELSVNLMKPLSNDNDLPMFDGEEMCKWLDKEEETIKNELSDCIPCEKSQLFRDDRFLKIYPAQIDKVRKLLKLSVPVEYHKEIDQALYNLVKVKFKDFLNYYRYVVDNIAEKLGKTLNPLVIEGDDVYVDPKKIGKWSNTLIHIFRNAIDHGIETLEERITMNKPQYGRIKVKITDTDSEVCIEISDDGRGIDFQQVSKRILDKGLIEPEKLKDMKEESLMEYIFIDGFSTKENVDLVSGRGTGLSAVKNEWDKLGGGIKVFSEKDNGTSFVFKIKKPI